MFGDPVEPTMAFWYRLTWVFDQSRGVKWQDYIRWSGLSHVRSLITLDASLCESVITELNDEDWHHNVHEGRVVDLFWDLGYLLNRVPSDPSLRVLAVVREPSEECCAILPDRRFWFAGYDIVEDQGDISVLTNCRELPLAYTKEDVSGVGLLSELAHARAVRDRLILHYSDNPHVPDCKVWAIWCASPWETKTKKGD